MEESLIEMYLAGVSVRWVEDITEALWGNKVSPFIISELNKNAYVHIEDWQNRPLRGGCYPYAYLDRIYLRRNEDRAICWVTFFQWPRWHGLGGVKLVIGDKCLDTLEAVGEVFPQAKYQRCTVHFYRNVFSVTPHSKVKLVANMLKAIHARESKRAVRENLKLW